MEKTKLGIGILFLFFISLNIVYGYAGDVWVKQNSSPPVINGGIDMLKYDDNGTVLWVIHNGGLNKSTNYGVTWTTAIVPYTLAGSSGDTCTFDISNNGSIMLAGASLARQLVNSSDGGTTWTVLSNSPTAIWNAVKMSKDGTIMVAGPTAAVGILYISNNSGNNWTIAVNDTLRNWQQIAMSRDGKYIYAAQATTNAYPWVSNNYGITWTQQNFTVAIRRVATNANGSIVYGAQRGGSVLVKSTNYGVTWTNLTSPNSEYINTIETNADGTMVIIGTTNDVAGYVYISTNGGVNWTAKVNDLSRYWASATGTYNFNHLAIANTITTGQKGVWTSDYFAPVMNSSRVAPIPAYFNSTLQGFCNATKAGGGNLTYYYTWYLNGASNTTGNTSNNKVQGIETNVNNITSGLIHFQNWTLQCTAYDNTSNSTALNSSILQISNYAPTITQLKPPNGNITTNSFMFFNWTATDPELDSLSYILYSDTNINPITLIYNGSNTYYNWTNLLDGLRYWKVLVNDTYNTTISSVWNFTIINIHPTINSTNITPSNFTTYDNLTITANVTSGTNPISSVWAVIWRGITTIWEGILNFVSGTIYSVTIGTNSSFEGELNITIYANDTLGYNATEITSQIYGNNPAPGIILNSPQDGYLFTIGTTSITLNYTSSDNNPLITDNIYVTNGTGYVLVDTQNHSPGTYTYELDTLDGYTYHWHVLSNDSDGSYNTSETRDFKINATIPSYNNLIVYPTPINESQILYINLTTNDTAIASIFITINNTNLTFTKINATDYSILIDTTGLSDITNYTINANMSYGGLFELYFGNITVYNGYVSLDYPSYPYVPFWEIVKISSKLTNFVNGSFVSGANVTMYLNSTNDYTVAPMIENTTAQSYDIYLRFTNKTAYNFIITGKHSLYYNYSGYFDVSPMCNVTVRLWKDLNKSDIYTNNFGYILFSYEPPTKLERSRERNQWAYTLLVNFKEWGDQVMNFSTNRQYRFKTKVFHANYTDGTANINIPCGDWAFYFVSGDWQFNPTLSYDWTYVDETYSRNLYLPRTNLTIANSTIYDFYVTQSDLYPDKVFWKYVLIWGSIIFIVLGCILIMVTTGDASLVIKFLIAIISLVGALWGILWMFWLNW